MAKSMMARAIRGGVKVDFLLADAWFGTKAMLRSTEELSLTAIVRMKSFVCSSLKLRFQDFQRWGQVAGLVQKSNLCASQWFLSPK
jgi:hypothetical protein